MIFMFKYFSMLASDLLYYYTNNKRERVYEVHNRNPVLITWNFFKISKKRYNKQVTENP